MSADAIVERNKATFRRLQEEVIVKGRLELLEEIFAPEFHASRSGLAGLSRVAGRPPYPVPGAGYEEYVPSTSHERFVQAYRAMITTLSDQERVIEELTGEGNVIWARWRIRATHAAELLRVPATGKRVEWIEVGMIQFNDEGLIVEGWFLCDEIDLALQLGIPIG